MKRLLTLMLLIGAALPHFAQTTSFQKEFQVAEGDNYPFFINEWKGNGYILSGSIDITTTNVKPLLVLINDDGDVIKSLETDKVEGDISDVYGHSDNALYVAIHSVLDDESDNKSLILAKLDKQFDLEILDTFFVEGFDSESAKIQYNEKSNDLIIVSRFHKPDFFETYVLRHNLLEKKTIVVKRLSAENTPTRLVYNLELTEISSNNFVFNIYLPGIGDTIFRINAENEIIGVNSLPSRTSGNVNQRYSQLHLMTGISKLNNYGSAFGIARVTHSNFQIPIVKYKNLMFIKFNENFDTLKTNIIGYDEEIQYPGKAKYAADGQLYMSGIANYSNQYFPPSSDSRGRVILFKVDTATLDTIWHREFGIENANCETTEMIPTDDGGCLLLGTVYYPFEKQERKILLIKVDSDGNVLSNRTVALPKPKALKVFPNPAQDYVQLALPDNQLTERIAVFDVSGRKVLSLANPQVDQLKVDQLPKGQYWINVTTQEEVVYSGSFVKL